MDGTTQDRTGGVEASRSGTPRYANNITRGDTQISFKALLESLPQPHAPRQYKEVSESEYVYSEREPSDLEGYLQRYSSEYPFFYCREVAWLPSKGVALCVFKKKEDGYKHKLDQHLVDGTCELFWRSQAAAIHYVGRFRLVEGVFPYEDRELASIRKELKKATRMHPTRSRNVKYEFVVLEYMGRTDDFVEPLIRGGFMRRSDEPLV